MSTLGNFLWQSFPDDLVPVDMDALRQTLELQGKKAFDRHSLGDQEVEV